jgi:hypothetical protein
MRLRPSPLLGIADVNADVAKSTLMTGLFAGCVLLAFAGTPARAQQITGAPGSPEWAVLIGFER